jgi:hypothetical protein
MGRSLESRRVAIAIVLVLLGGCGSTKALKEPLPTTDAGPLVSARDPRLEATVDSVVVLRGPGAWTRHGDWDEYRLRIRPLGPAPIHVRSVSLVDAVGTSVRPMADRAALLEASLEARERRALSGPVSGDSLLMTGSAFAAAGQVAAGSIAASSLGAAAIPGSQAAAFAAAGGGAVTASMGAAVASAAAIGGAVIVGIGLMRMIQDAEIDAEIKRRHTPLPVAIAPPDTRLTLFFPTTPVPTGVAIAYASGDAEHVLEIDTREPLARLHIPPPPRLLKPVEPRFPREAAWLGIESGRVKARLTIAATGDVAAVEVLEAEPSVHFAPAAVHAFRFWKYDEGVEGREAIEVMDFKL